MKIKYNALEKTIEIKDELRNHYLLIKLVMLLNLISASINFFETKGSGLSLIKLAWIVIALVSLFVLVLFLVKKSTLNKIPIATIKALEKKYIFGKTYYYLKLTNGKKRHLISVCKESEYQKVKRIMDEIGIPILNNQSLM